MTETELYKELGTLTKNKDKWEENIPYVSSLLTHESEKIKTKALWQRLNLIFMYLPLIIISVKKLLA